MSQLKSATLENVVADEESFLKTIPYSLVATNLKGVYASPARPDHFDVNAATAAELVNNGIPWRRPSLRDDPGLVAAWNNHFSRKWLAKDRIVPQLVPQTGRTHHLRGGAINPHSNGPTPWAGAYIPGAWTSVSGSWQVPTVSTLKEGQGTEGGWNSSSWLGIDGYNPAVSNDVLQAGIEQKVSANGNASYIAWFEWFAPGQNTGGITGFSNKAVLQETSPLSPSLASLNNNLSDVHNLARGIIPFHCIGW
jgi:hypothetical protein